jgi:hypothetical protein
MPCRATPSHAMLDPAATEILSERTMPFQSRLAMYIMTLMAEGHERFFTSSSLQSLPMSMLSTHICTHSLNSPQPHRRSRCSRQHSSLKLLFGHILTDTVTSTHHGGLVRASSSSSSLQTSRHASLTHRSRGGPASRGRPTTLAWPLGRRRRRRRRRGWMW